MILDQLKTWMTKFINNKFLIIGSGNIARLHASILKEKFKFCKIFFLIRKKTKTFEIFCKKNKYELEVNIDNIKLLSFEAIFICSPSSKHCEHFSFFKNNTKKFFIEKPLSNNYQIAKKCFQNVTNKKLIHVGYNLVFDEMFIKMKKILNKNNFGKLLRVDCTTGQNLSYWRKKINYKKTVTANKSLGGGVLLELSHELNYLIWFLGAPLKVNSFVCKHSELKIDVEDYANKNMIFKNKVIGNISIDFYREDKTRRVEFIFTKCTVELDYFKRKITLKKKSGSKIIRFKNNLRASYVNQINYFFENNKSANAINLYNAMLTLSIIDRCKNKIFKL